MVTLIFICLFQGIMHGVVYLTHRSRKVLRSDRWKFIELLCVQVAISIANAKLYESIQSSEKKYVLTYSHARSLATTVFTLPLFCANCK